MERVISKVRSGELDRKDVPEGEWVTFKVRFLVWNLLDMYRIQLQKEKGLTRDLSYGDTIRNLLIEVGFEEARIFPGEGPLTIEEMEL